MEYEQQYPQEDFLNRSNRSSSSSSDSDSDIGADIDDVQLVIYV
jgi:hypothetical protein